MEIIDMRFSDEYKDKILDDFLQIINYLKDRMPTEWGETIGFDYLSSANPDMLRRVTVNSKSISFSVIDSCHGDDKEKIEGLIETVITQSASMVGAGADWIDGSSYSAIAEIIIDWVQIKEKYNELYNKYNSNKGWIMNFIV